MKRIKDVGKVLLWDI